MEFKYSKFVRGQYVKLLDVPKIRKSNGSYGTDVGWKDDMNDGVFGIYMVDDVTQERGRFVYKLQLPRRCGGFIRWWVEEEWIELAPGMTEELDKFLSEWGE